MAAVASCVEPYLALMRRWSGGGGQLRSGTSRVDMTTCLSRTTCPSWTTFPSGDSAAPGGGVGGAGGASMASAAGAALAWAAGAAWAAGVAWGSGSSSWGHLHVSAKATRRAEAEPPLRRLHRARQIDAAPRRQPPRQPPKGTEGTGCTRLGACVRVCVRVWVRVCARARAATRRRPRWVVSARSAAWKMMRGEATQSRYGQWMQPRPKKRRCSWWAVRGGVRAGVGVGVGVVQG